MTSPEERQSSRISWLTLSFISAIASILVIYFVVPGYAIALLLKLQGWKKDDPVPSWLEIVFFPSIFVGEHIPRVGNFYESQIRQILGEDV